MIADEVMTRDPVTVTEQASIGDALSLLAEQGIRHLPVVRGSRRRRDPERPRLPRARASRSCDDLASYEQLRARLTQPVSTLMIGDVITVGRDAEATEIVDLMLEEKLSALPVVETGTQELAGIVSYVDLLRAALPLLEEAELAVFDVDAVDIVAQQVGAERAGLLAHHVRAEDLDHREQAARPARTARAAGRRLAAAIACRSRRWPRAGGRAPAARISPHASASRRAGRSTVSSSSIFSASSL